MSLCRWNCKVKNCGAIESNFKMVFKIQTLYNASPFNQNGQAWVLAGNSQITGCNECSEILSVMSLVAPSQQTEYRQQFGLFGLLLQK